MRVICKKCNKWVKDKFIFGFLHNCVTDEELEYRTKFFSCACDGAPVGHIHTGLDGEPKMPIEVMYRTRKEWDELNKKP